MENENVKVRLRIYGIDADPDVSLLSFPLHVSELMDPQTQIVFIDDTTLRVRDVDFGTERVVFERFTGVRDSNGEDIYEGDYIKAGFYDCQPNTGPQKVFSRLGCWYAENIGEIGHLSSFKLAKQEAA